MSKILKKLKVK